MSKSEEYKRGHREGQEAANLWVGSYVVVFEQTRTPKRAPRAPETVAIGAGKH